MISYLRGVTAEHERIPRKQKAGLYSISKYLKSSKNMYERLEFGLGESARERKHLRLLRGKRAKV